MFSVSFLIGTVFVRFTFIYACIEGLITIESLKILNITEYEQLDTLNKVTIYSMQFKLFVDIKHTHTDTFHYWFLGFSLLLKT